MKQINLIPTEMAVPAKTVTISKSLNKISTIGATFLLVMVLASISILVYYNMQYKKIVYDTDILKDKIGILERSEQKLVLAKDKLAKITQIKKADFVDDELSSFENFEQQILAMDESALSETDISPLKIKTSLSFKTSSYLTSSLEFLSKFPKFKRIILTSLNYNPSAGFLVDITLED